MTPQEYLARWGALEAPASSIELQAAEVVVGSRVWIARDDGQRLHLLVLVEEGAVLPAALPRGLGVAIGRHRIAGLPDAVYVDLVCLDQEMTLAFATVAAEVTEAVVNIAPSERLPDLTAVLNKWQWFWSADVARMSINDAIGLFGELWFLLRWATLTRESISGWNVYDQSRHDFQWTERSVEVKTSSRAGAVLHTIQSLDQLAPPETGQLYLFSLHIARDALASNTLASLVDSAISQLADAPAARELLLGKLNDRNYTPVAEGSQIAYRVTEESLYSVSGEFPRLTWGSFSKVLHPAITDVSYRVNMNACSEWQVATSPEDWSLLD